MDLDDAKLMQNWQAGDESAFDLLVEKYQKRVLAVAYRFLLNPIEAEDVAQEAFIRLYRARDRYQPKAKFSSFLFTIVNRLCLNVLRQRRSHPVVLLDENIKTEEEPLHWKGEKQLSATQVLEQQEQQNVILQAMQGLSSDEHMALVLDYWEDMPLENIAEVMHKSIPAIKSILFRARTKLRGKLSAYFSA